MKIKTITCHDVYNHGASLQAYALQNYLRSLGHEVEIIDYKPDYLSGHFNLWTVSSHYDKFVLRELYLICKLPNRLLRLRRKKKFDEFTKRYLILTKRYSSFKQLLSDTPKSDVYIAGSDQIWNTNFRNGLDRVFYLGFVTDASNRISYAASFAHDSDKEKNIEFVAEQLKNFDAISVREESGVKLLKVLGYNGVQVCDPVFLLDREKWNKLAFYDFSNQKYILVYDFESNPKIECLALRMAKRLRCKIYSIGPYRLSYADKNLIYYGPDAFVSAIRDAFCVISNSFHGSAFSILYHKDFFVVKREDGLNDRMLSFLEHYALSDRLVDENTSEDVLFSKIDYHDIEPLLQRDILFSKQFLHNNIHR